MMKKWSMAALALIVVAALTACGGGSGASGGGTATEPPVEPTGNTVDVTITGSNFKFDQEEYQVKAGDTVTISYADEQGMHGMLINGLNINLKNGQSATFVAQPGEYNIVCSIMCGPGHSKMAAKLIVE